MPQGFLSVESRSGVLSAEVPTGCERRQTRDPRRFYKRAERQPDTMERKTKISPSERRKVLGGIPTPGSYGVGISNPLISLGSGRPLKGWLGYGMATFGLCLAYSWSPRYLTGAIPSRSQRPGVRGLPAWPTPPEDLGACVL